MTEGSHILWLHNKVTQQNKKVTTELYTITSKNIVKLGLKTKKQQCPVLATQKDREPRYTTGPHTATSCISATKTTDAAESHPPI